jgi:site-specific recombinase XerD
MIGGDSTSDNAGKSGAISTVPVTPPLSGKIEADPGLRADQAGAYAFNTLRAYRANWRDWAAWCERHRKSPLPADIRALRDYLVDLAAGRKVSTLRQRLAAIVRAHRLAGAPFDTKDPILVNVMRRLSREKGTAPEGRQALGTAELLEMVRGCDRDLRGLRDRALLLLGFASGLRRSELVDLYVKDLDWRRDGLILTVRRSKTDQAGRGQTVAVLYGRRESSCPVRATKRWIAAAQLGDGPLFRPIKCGTAQPRRMSDRMVALIVKGAAERAGIDPTRLAGHSLRSGHATESASRGADLSQVRDQLRHRRLETTAGYIKARGLTRNNSSGKLGL